jgi:hypothetical protein
MLIFLLVAILSMGHIQVTYADTVPENIINNRFERVPEPKCAKAKAVEPHLPANSAWYGRYYINVDNGKYCQILDVKIDWLTEDALEFRKYLNSVLYRFDGVSWMENYAISYPPSYRIYDKEKKLTYLVIKNDWEDFPIDEIVYFSGSWDDSNPSKKPIETLWPCDRNEDCYNEYKLVKRAAALLAPKK